MVESLKCFWRADKFENESFGKIRKIFIMVTYIWKGYMFVVCVFCIYLCILPLLDIQSKMLILTNFTLCNSRILTCWLANYVWQVFLLWLQGLPTVLGFDLLFIIFTAYVCAAIKLLKIGLTKLNTDDLYKRKHILRNIINQHDFMMNFVNVMNDMFTTIMFLQFYCSLWSLVLTQYMMVADRWDI